MLRRTFLATGVAAAHGLAAGPIVDTHTHFYDPYRPGGVPWPHQDEKVLYRTVLPPEYIKLVKPLGVTGTIAIEASPWLSDNRWLLDLARRYPVIVGVIGHLNPGQSDFRAHLEHFADNPLFRGIRLGGSSDLAGQQYIDGLRHMAELGLTVDMLGGPEMLESILTVADKLPDLRIVIDHLPFVELGGAAARRRYHRELRELGERPHVYAQVSNILRRNPDTSRAPLHCGRQALDELWQIFASDRVLYGSNWSVSDLAASYGEVLRASREYVMSKGSGIAEKFFSQNSRAAYL